MKQAKLLAISPILLLGACTAGSGFSSGPAALPAINVAASGETAPVGTANDDAADDPAVWLNPADPAQSLIVGTDKKAGLYVYGLDGKVRSFLPAGRLNNVDLLPIEGGALVVSSDRNDIANSRIALFRLTPDGELAPLGTVDSGPGEAYGICLQRKPGFVSPQTGGMPRNRVQIVATAYAALKDGTVREVTIYRPSDGAEPAAAIRREWKLASQIEGCVTDPSSGDLYISEEDVGIWGIHAAQYGAQPDRIASVGSDQGLVPDVEGLAFLPREGGTGYLVASSQGDNAYAVLDSDSGHLLGRFRISGGAIGSTEETDGIELAAGNFGSDYPDGLFVAQDGQNAPEAQNFKLVSWMDIKAALGLE